MDNTISPCTDLPILDWPLAIQLVGGKEALAHEMFTLFMNELPDAYQKITDAFNKQAFGPLKDETHRFLGGCSYCGVPRLKAATAALESALKKDVIDSVEIAHLFERFTGEIEALKIAVAE